MNGMVYEFDPGAQPDSDFIAGDLTRLVVGNHGRLLDDRRTPIVITAVIPERAAFELEIGGFEDAGARWELPPEEACHLQFDPTAATAPPELVARLQDLLERFSHDASIECDLAAREETLVRVASARTDARQWLARHDLQPPELTALIERRAGDPKLFALLDQHLSSCGVIELERLFADTFVRNPSSGELIKGHAIVLAELGLCPYHARVVRNRDLFAEPWTKQRRTDHIIARLAFIQELWTSWGYHDVTLYRGTAVDEPLPARTSPSFVSATFSRDVATDHFNGGPATHTAVLWRQQVPTSRLFMTFLETRAMNERFHEAEAILIGDPQNRAF